MKHPLDIALDHALKGEFDQSYDILKPLAEQGDLRAVFNTGWHEMRLGNFKQGMLCLTAGRYLNCFGNEAVRSGKPITDGKNLQGVRLLYRCEGGFGDQIATVRFAKDYADLGAIVTVACSPELFTLFRTLPFVHSLISTANPEAADHDCWVPSMSATVPLDYEYENISGKPYINVNPIQLNGDFKVGLRWSGNPKFEHEQHRRFPNELMSGLTDIEGITFYSLQRDDNMDAVPSNVVDLSSLMTDFYETAKIIAGLDLVITSCTSVAHLSAAMGIPTWIVVPVLPYYMWSLPSTNSPWYDSVILYKQKKHGEWSEIFDIIRSDLIMVRG